MSCNWRQVALGTLPLKLGPLVSQWTDFTFLGIFLFVIHDSSGVQPQLQLRWKCTKGSSVWYGGLILSVRLQMT